VPQPPATPATAPDPLTDAQLAELRDARRRGRKIARAAGVARVSGWLTAMFAATTLAWGLAALGLGSPDWAALAIGAGMVVIAAGEFAGARLLHRYDARGARLLACNQLVFGAMIVAYAAWMLLTSLSAPMDSATAELAAVDPEMAAMMADLTRTATVAVYSAVALGGALGPGLMAIYYFTRARHVRRFVRDTPEWARQALRATV
jgi:uncharacterized membrane protein YfcA